MEHHFNVEEAKLYGIECAILLYNIRFWINKNKANGKHMYKGRYWTYNSSRAFAELFPYLSPSQIARHLRKLEELNVLISDNFNTMAYDKTKWYAINENPCTELNKDSLKMNNPCTELNKDSLKMNNGLYEIEQPIPDNKTDNKKADNKQHIFYKKNNFKFWNLEDFENDIKLHRAEVNLTKDDLMNFYHHWIEMAPSGKMKFQMEKTWQTNLRLKKWESNKMLFEKQNIKNDFQGTKQKMNNAFEEVMNKILNE